MVDGKGMLIFYIFFKFFLIFFFFNKKATLEASGRGVDAGKPKSLPQQDHSINKFNSGPTKTF
jgi:hypothetical protein